MHPTVSILAIALAATLSVSAHAADLTISGEIVESTCTADIAGDVDVDMGKMDLVELNANDRIGRRDLDVTLACPGSGAAQELAVRFSGVANTDGSLALTAASSAVGVGYKIYDNADTQLRINTAPTRFVNVPADGSEVLKHSVWFSKTEAAAQAGTAHASAQMDIVYK
ncbi:MULTISPECIES: fimbrial protein [Stenotrophomonas maltophilia group]|uniref:fimbrial protein n=1 Tax=Stenotrophomonas maltophilia group TaxID=995085 RepID=UPI0018D30E67|nr:type 1 fimbrial protein [Stenotrophomonas maltophilia]HDS1299935.1 type 1 fimbrial protein [Stenotrophomonas maltophilia]HDS1521702.1 type 1 fimbrial protein [Stenotrophomonas maltophilia]HDS1657704.1 type 1 fimbrial protein [Stenotrophomonas maltophilia]HDS1670758.1 type 1 fimbrial protein [Stenotrophomonas maltophilia]